MGNSVNNGMGGFSERNPPVDFVPKEFVGPVSREDQADRRHLRWSKTVVTISMTIVVALMNWMVIDMLNMVVAQEMHMISMGSLPPENRTVTTGVYLALIGGTVAEVSALFFIIVKNMFKNGSAGDGKESVVSETESTS